MTLVGLAVTYAVSMAQYLPFGDGMAFYLATLQPAPDLGVNATNHVMYQFLAWNLGQLVENKVWLLTAMSALAAVFTIQQLQVLLKQMQISTPHIVLASLTLGHSFTFWRHASLPEVYAPYLLWLVIQLRLCYSMLVSPKGINVVLAGLFMGLGFWLHIAHILFVPAWCYLCIMVYKRNTGLATVALGVSMVPILLLVYTAHVQFGAEVWNRLLFDGAGSGAVLTIDPTEIPKGIGLGIGMGIYNLGLPLMGLLAGFLLTRKLGKAPSINMEALADDQPFRLNRGVWRWTLLIFLGTSLVYACRYANLQVAPFYLPIYMVGIIWLTASLQGQTWARQLVVMRSWAIGIVALPFSYLATYLGTSQMAGLKDFSEQKAYKGGLGYYTLPWQKANLDARDVILPIAERERARTQTTQDSLLIEDMGYTYPIGKQILQAEGRLP